ncbi:hypothetical protein DPMN_026676 [Dreissena polymorpha]|uniref:Uncharacterized protein n=1 Tax=Dreissena polymorpha TaxID=45954 RepID=A0A9D4RCU0_DREPO|nr:hypothetical protein DPMN_026676 [Dreissena polymorpha]
MQKSANMRTEDFAESGRSLVWQRDSRGPWTVHWGTPESTVAGFNSSPPTTTFIFLSVRRSSCKILMVKARVVER